MPFYQLYTPTDIQKKAEFTEMYESVTTRAMTFDVGSILSGRLFKLPLLPSELLNDKVDIIIVITIGLDNSIQSEDSDPKFFISDGENGVGFEIREEPSAHRCRGIQAVMGDKLTSMSSFVGSAHNSTFLSEQFILTLKPSQGFGSCYSAIDSGLISPVGYKREMSLNKGLFLEVYREDTHEKYVFNYILVEIHEN